MKKYSPRRQSAKWLDSDCPRGVLAIYDHPAEFDRYTVFYVEPVAGSQYADMWLWYRGMSDNPSSAHGVGVAAEMEAHQVAAYRYENRNHACRWSSLPEAVQAVVRRDTAVS